MGDFTCTDCVDREIGCHDKCDKYKREVLEHNRIKANLEKSYITRSYVCERIIKSKRKKSSFVRRNYENCD